MTLPVKADPQWFNSLSAEEQIRLFPSYINVLHELLAQAYAKKEKAKAREEKFMEAIDEAYERSQGDIAICKACFKIGNPLSCRKCEERGCGECNTTTKGLARCGVCQEDYCEKCDPLVLEKGLTQSYLDSLKQDDSDAEREDWMCSECTDRH